MTEQQIKVTKKSLISIGVAWGLIAAAAAGGAGYMSLVKDDKAILTLAQHTAEDVRMHEEELKELKEIVILLSAKDK